MTSSISREILFKIWVKTPKNSKFDNLIAYVLQEIGDLANSEVALACIKTKIRNFCQKVNSKWEKVAKYRQRFLDNYSSWLHENIIFSDGVFKAVSNTLRSDTPTVGPGRPFSTCGPKAKKLKIQHLLQSTSEELSTATEIQLRKEGKRDSAAIVKELSAASPKRVRILRRPVGPCFKS